MRDEVIYRLPPHELRPHQVLIVEDLKDERDWGHTPLMLRECHDLTRGEGVTVAVLDTGVDAAHPDLRDRVGAQKDFTGSDSGVIDVQGHGTHCAGIVAASGDGEGVVGAAPACRVINAKVLGDNGSGGSRGIAAGIAWAVSQGADIISMSLGSNAPDPVILAAMRDADAKGVYVFCAAGNDRQGVDYPGAYPECVAVAAVGVSLQVASFSSRGKEVDVAAPGVNVLSCIPGGRYARYSGTSMATPYVAGCVALYLSLLRKHGIKKPTPDDLYTLLTKTAKDLESPGFDVGSGFGLVQPLELLKSVQVPAPAPTPTPPPTPTPVRYTAVIEFDAASKRFSVLTNKDAPAGEVPPAMTDGEVLGYLRVRYDLSEEEVGGYDASGISPIQIWTWAVKYGQDAINCLQEVYAAWRAGDALALVEIYEKYSPKFTALVKEILTALSKKEPAA